jgi:hypothetical protein
MFNSDSFSLIITLSSLIFAILKYSQTRKLKTTTEIQALTLHQNIALALGAIQEAEKLTETNKSPHIQIGRAEGICQALLVDSASFYCNLINITIDDIKERAADGRLSKDYIHIYNNCAIRPYGKLRNYARKFYYWLW